MIFASSALAEGVFVTHPGFLNGLCRLPPRPHLLVYERTGSTKYGVTSIFFPFRSLVKYWNLVLNPWLNCDPWMSCVTPPSPIQYERTGFNRIWCYKYFRWFVRYWNLLLDPRLNCDPSMRCAGPPSWSSIQYERTESLKYGVTSIFFPFSLVSEAVKPCIGSLIELWSLNELSRSLLWYNIKELHGSIEYGVTSISTLYHWLVEYCTGPLFKLILEWAV